MKKIFEFFCGFYATILFALAYAIAMAAASIIEGIYGTPAAKDAIYGTIWFDVLHALLGLNLIAVFVYKKIYKSKKYFVLVLHCSFILILIGAGLTRYLGFEGVMHIKEGYSSNVIISNEEYINIRAGIDGAVYKAEIPVSFSEFSDGKFDESIPLNDDFLRVKFLSFIPAQDKNSLPELNINASYKGESKDITLYQSFLLDEPNAFSADGIDFEFSWGPKESILPFNIYLEDFELERYAGSMNPSSYSSSVIVRDGDNEMPFKIFMNNVLDYAGYRFFQSSYDADEKGTILSVNKDPGKITTYIGYGLLIIGFLWGFLAKNGRFRILARKLKENQIGCLFFIFLFASANLYAYPSMEQNNTESAPNHSDFGIREISNDDILRVLNNMKKNTNSHSKKLGRILVQDFNGRIKPFDTLCAEIVHKITGSDGFLGLNNVEIALGMMTYYDSFQQIKMFKTSTKELRKILGVDENEKYISFLDAFDGSDYKLANYVEDANRQDPQNRDSLQKDILKLNEKISIAYIVYTAQILNIFPDLGGSNAWLSPADAILAFDEENAKRISNMLSNYFSGVDKGVRQNAWSEADLSLEQLVKFQRENATIALPTDSNILLEIALNHYSPFKNLIFAYLFLGLVLLVLGLICVIKNKMLNQKVNAAIYALLLLSGLIHSLGLAARWIVGNHAPWSNAYESMIYIAWAGIIAGIIFFKRFPLALSMAALMSGITLFVAHLGFMDPQITTLVPVLKSYWLNIHVSVITASYGFFGLSFMLAIITLILFNVNAKAHIKKAILNLSYINEMSILLGLGLLTIGNFLGGIWANESWGRYWGWDSKETWSLITIVIYALVAHMRFIPRFNSPFALSVGALLGFYSVLMTYFGVNFYLVGKHSYASGEMPEIPLFLYVMIIATILLIFFAKRKSRI